MEFALQTGHPRIVSPARRRFSDLASAMQSIFPMQTEDAILSYNHVPIRLNYKYDLSVLIDDLVPLLERLLGSNEGHAVVKWGSDTFRAHWHMQWSEGSLRIYATWASVSGGYETLLNERGDLELPVASFVAEWRGVLAVIADAFERSGGALDDEAILNGLRRVIAASDQHGQLYP